MASPMWGHSFRRVRSVQEDAASAKPNTIPERYIRPPRERPCLSVPIAGDDLEIPVIDMTRLSLPEEKLKLFSACAEWGFFQLINHGIPESLMNDVKRAGRKFFSLPVNEKQKYAVKASDLQGYGQTFVVSDEQKIDWVDLLGLILSPPSCRNFSVWPDYPSHFREVLQKYYDEIARVAETMLEEMAEALGLKRYELKQMFGGAEDVYVKMRMNMYPPCAEPELVNGLSPHADMTGLAVLLQDDHVVGLQVKYKESWVAVKPQKNALVINIGNVMEVLSNGIFKSVEHRVVTNRFCDRLSVAFFYAPAFDSVVSPASNLVDETHPAVFRAFVHSDYINYYFSRTVEGKHSFYSFAAVSPPALCSDHSF